MMVSHHDHHRHSAYLLGHVDASSFSQSQLRKLAALVLGQRGELMKLAEHLHDSVTMSQVLCLRLAIILHHARIELPPKVVALAPLRSRKAGGQVVRSVQLQLATRWAQQHPRTLHLLQEETRRWALQGERKLELALV
jgi:exopolyphosphatase/guanosine-5'-triphosphate,3'-diphosphate pyrophosphatase